MYYSKLIIIEKIAFDKIQISQIKFVQTMGGLNEYHSISSHDSLWVHKMFSVISKWTHECDYWVQANLGHIGLNSDSDYTHDKPQ